MLCASQTFYDHIVSILRRRIIVLSIKTLSRLAWLMEIPPSFGKTPWNLNGQQNDL